MNRCLSLERRGRARVEAELSLRLAKGNAITIHHEREAIAAPIAFPAVSSTRIEKHHEPIFPATERTGTMPFLRARAEIGQ